MELKDYLRILRQRWILITVTTLLAVAVAAVLTIMATPQYQSTARLFVTTPSASDDGQLQSGGQFSQQRVKSYAALITGDEVARRVVDQLEIDETPGQLRQKISTSLEVDTVVLSVSVEDPSAERAQQLTQGVADVFTGYVRELETPEGQNDAPVKATVVDRATVPSTPVSPRPVRNLGLGLLLGLLVGAGLAVLREILDNRIRSVQDISTVSGQEVPLLGNIFYDKNAVSQPLVRELPADHPRREAFRVLRTNLSFVDPGAAHKVYTVTSALPGEGKSSTATNLAQVLADGGYRVLLVEADLRRPRAAEYLNVESGVGVTTILLGRVDLADAIQPIAPDFDFLASGRVPPNPAELLQSDEMVKLLAQVRDEYDLVLVDAPPLLPVTDAAVLATETDGAIVVVRHGATTTDQYASALDRLAAVDARLCGTIVTMTPAARRGDGSGYGSYGYGYSAATQDRSGGARAERRRGERGARRKAVPES